MNQLDAILPGNGIRACVAAKRLGITPRQVSDLIREKKMMGLLVIDSKRKVYVTTEEWLAAYLKRHNPDLRRY